MPQKEKFYRVNRCLYLSRVNNSRYRKRENELQPYPVAP